MGELGADLHFLTEGFFLIISLTGGCIGKIPLAIKYVLERLLISLFCDHSGGRGDLFGGPSGNLKLLLLLGGSEDGELLDNVVGSIGEDSDTNTTS